MALNDQDQARIREYLLGRLNDDDQQKIEERLMVEDDLFEELEISKGELIEEYRAGELSQYEQSFFERSFLATPEGKQRHLFAVALDCIGPAPAPKPITLWDRLRAFFGPQLSPVTSAGESWSVGGAIAQRWQVIALTAVAAVALLVVYVSFLPSKTFVAVTLTNSFINRATGDARYQPIPLNGDVGEVRITLTLPHSAPSGVTYRAEFDDRTNITSLTPVSQNAGSVLVVIPVKQLPPGLYSIRLSAIHADGTAQKLPGDYLFKITK